MHRWVTRCHLISLWPLPSQNAELLATSKLCRWDQECGDNSSLPIVGHLILYSWEHPRVFPAQYWELRFGFLVPFSLTKYRVSEIWVQLKPSSPDMPYIILLLCKVPSLTPSKAAIFFSQGVHFSQKTYLFFLNSITWASWTTACANCWAILYAVPLVKSGASFLCCY